MWACPQWAPHGETTHWCPHASVPCSCNGSCSHSEDPHSRWSDPSICIWSGNTSRHSLRGWVLDSSHIRPTPWECECNRHLPHNNCQRWRDVPHDRLSGCLYRGHLSFWRPVLADARSMWIPSTYGLGTLLSWRVLAHRCHREPFQCPTMKYRLLPPDRAVGCQGRSWCTPEAPIYQTICRTLPPSCWL